MDCELEQKEPCERKLSTWVITYHVHGNSYYEGVAVVQAYDVKCAETIFMSKTHFNGICQTSVCIECIKEVYCLPEPDLLAEVSVKEYKPIWKGKKTPRKR